LTIYGKTKLQQNFFLIYKALEENREILGNSVPITFGKGVNKPAFMDEGNECLAIPY
jgi:hypothetical protein